MTKQLTVLSLFDGMSCGQLALQKLGINVGTYFASEIDEDAIAVTKANFPDTIHIGDITKVTYEDGVLYTENGEFDVGHIDLVIGGSPCQGFSKAGKSLNFNDPRSMLFFKFVDLLESIEPTNFLLENVIMHSDHVDVISERLRVKPMYINSALLSAQNRPRIYWTNIPNVEMPEDKGICLRDIIDVNVKPTKRNLDRLKTSHFSELGAKEFQTDCVGFTVITRYVANKEPNPVPKWIKKHNETIVIRNNKHGTLTTSNGYLIKINGDDYDPSKPFENCIIRKATIDECEMLQTVPLGYTGVTGFSNTKREKMLGNGWTVDVIAHIFQNIVGV